MPNFLEGMVLKKKQFLSAGRKPKYLFDIAEKRKESEKQVI